MSLPRDPRCPIGWGTRSGYTNHRCRCRWCRAAHAREVRAKRAERRAAANGGHPIGKPESYTTYLNYGCRCDACRAAWRAYRRQVAS